MKIWNTIVLVLVIIPRNLIKKSILRRLYEFYRANRRTVKRLHNLNLSDTELKKELDYCRFKFRTQRVLLWHQLTTKKEY